MQAAGPWKNGGFLLSWFFIVFFFLRLAGNQQGKCVLTTGAREGTRWQGLLGQWGFAVSFIFLTPNLNLPWHNVRPFPSVPSLLPGRRSRCFTGACVSFTSSYVLPFVLLGWCQKEPAASAAPPKPALVLRNSQITDGCYKSTSAELPPSSHPTKTHALNNRAAFMHPAALWSCGIICESPRSSCHS